jgi:hypothetical protein
MLSNIFRKNAENAATNKRAGLELGGCKTLNGFAQQRELSLPIYVTASRSADEFVDCGRADLTLDFLAAAEHRKPERHSARYRNPKYDPALAALKSPAISKMLGMLGSMGLVERVFPYRFNIIQNVGLISPSPARHFLSVEPHREAIGTWWRHMQVGSGGSKSFAYGRSSMRPALDDTRVSKAIRLTKNFDYKQHGESSQSETVEKHERLTMQHLIRQNVHRNI